MQDQAQRPDIFDDDDRADESTVQRAKSKLTDPSESKELYSEIGEGVQKLAGGTKRVETDRLRVIENTQTDSDPPFLDDESPLLPDGAFVTAPSPDTPVPITYAAPGPETETSPYEGISGTIPFGEGDEIRGWTTGLGEEEGKPPSGDPTPGEQLESRTD